MFGVKRVLKIDLDGKSGLRSKNQDRVVVVTGGEGKGKSNLLLGMFDIWYKELLEVKDYDESYIKYFGANKKEFITGMYVAPKYHMIVHDEALKDLYARDSISSFNKDLNKAYFVIRGKNLYTALACPSILDLDPNFRKRRIWGMFHVYSAGKVAYYGRDKLNKLIPALMKMSMYNARPDPRNARDEKYKLIAPDFTDTFPMYKGVLLKRYLERKDSNMDKIVKELVDKYADGDEGEEDNLHIKTRDKVDLALMPKVKKLLDEGVSIKDIRKQMHTNYYSLRRIIARITLEKKDDSETSA